MTLENKRILLIISGGIAAYKSLELIRLIKKAGGQVRCILTEGGSHFITPLSVAALSGEKCYTDLWSLTDETEMGHIRLSREADLVVVAPASADIMAKMAHGLCNDLATTALLATDKPVMIAPAMNPYMWENVATQDNLRTLINRGIKVIMPTSGDMACGETGTGRMMEPQKIIKEIIRHCEEQREEAILTNLAMDCRASPSASLAMTLLNKTAIVTSGPTYEPIDPVRFIGNRSSGKQGHAIAMALRDAGATVTLITGPTALPDPENMTVVKIETAQQMLRAVEAALPADIAVCAAAVGDYGVEAYTQKQKKKDGPLSITLTDNPDILAALSNHLKRPEVVIGFAAETENLVNNAREKLRKKGCDAIIANQVGNADFPVFGQDETCIHWITKTEDESYKPLSKTDVASIVTEKITTLLKPNRKERAA